MAKEEKGSVRYLTDMKYKPDLKIEIRPDNKRIVIHQGEGDDAAAVWIDVSDVKFVAGVMLRIVDEIRANHVVEDEDDD